MLRKAGYDGVEWMLGQHFDSAGGAEAARRQDARGERLQVSNIMCWQDLVTRDEERRGRRELQILKEMVDCAGELSVPVMNVFTGPMTWNSEFARIGSGHLGGTRRGNRW